MKRSCPLAMVALAAIVTCTQLALAQSSPANDISVRISWPSKGPDWVAFEDRAEGRTNFTKGPGYFEGRRPRPAGVAYHNVAISYGAEQIPIKLRVHAGMHQLALEIEGPAQLPCSREVVTGLNVRPEGATQAARLRTLVQVRHLLRRQVDICARFGRRMLAEAYFWVSCSLAQDTDFFMVSEEAKTYFRQSGVPSAEAELAIRNCEHATRIADVRNMNAGRLAAREAGDYAQASQIGGALLVLAADDAWRSGFEALQIDAANIRATQVADLADWRDLASRSGDQQQALEANRQLTVLSVDPAYRLALAARSLDPAQLYAYNPQGGGGSLAQAEESRGAQDGRSYYPDDHYRDDSLYGERRLAGGDRVYRGRDGRYYCRREDGTTGLAIGPGVGGNSADRDRSGALGTVVGAAAGALIGREIERGAVRCR